MIALPEAVHGVVPTADLRPSPFNPRKTFDEASLRELADSFGVHGVLQPLVVRPVGAKVGFAKGKWTGVDHFEVVAGHRRLRAALLAGVRELPVVVRPLTDAQAREVMLIENARREGVPPSEEAAGVRELVDLVGLEKAAERTGTPLARVRDLVRLASLPPWFLAAVDRGDVPVSTAAVVAKVPGGASRERAAACVVLGLTDPRQLNGEWNDGEDWREAAANPTNLMNGAALSSRDAKELVRTHFSRQLKAAPFSRKSLDLVPATGGCDACPKRAGNDPELVREGVRGDVCTDPDCYEQKLAAYREQELAKAKKKHGAVPAEDLSWESWREYPKGWCPLDLPVGRSELNDPANPWTGKKAERPVDELLGSATFTGEKAVAFHPKTGKPVLLVRTKDARRALVAAGLIDKPERVKREAKPADPVKPCSSAEADGPMVRYRLSLDLAALGVLEFDAYADDPPAFLFDDAMTALENAIQVKPEALTWEAVGQVPVDETDSLGPELGRVESTESQPDPPAVDDSAGADGIPGQPKGEPIEVLGLTVDQLETVTSLAGFDPKKPTAVKPLELNGRRWVVTGKCYGGQKYITWDLLPLYTLAEFGKTHPAVPTRDRPGFLDDLDADRARHPAGFYGGLVLITGRGKTAEKVVVGVKGEQRRLLWVNPAAKAPVRAPALTPAAPVVCSPGSLSLRDVPGFPSGVADLLEARGVRTLLDLDARSADCKKQRRDPSPHNLLRAVEAEFGLSFAFDDLMAAGDALTDHLTVKPAPEPKAKKKKGTVTA